MYCRSCGTRVFENDQFCGSCGARLLEEAAPAPREVGTEIDQVIDTFEAGEIQDALSRLKGQVESAARRRDELALAQIADVSRQMVVLSENDDERADFEDLVLEAVRHLNRLQAPSLPPRLIRARAAFEEEDDLVSTVELLNHELTESVQAGDRNRLLQIMNVAEELRGGLEDWDDEHRPLDYVIEIAQRHLEEDGAASPREELGPQNPPQPPRPESPRLTAPSPSHVPVAQSTNGFAIASLVLGILWLYWIGSVLALVFGYVGKGQIDRSEGLQGGRGLAIAGIVLGWIGMGIFVLLLLAGVSLLGY